MDKDKCFESLVLVLGRLTEAHYALNEYSHSLQALIVAGDADRVNGELSVMSEIIAKINKIEDERLSLTDKCAVSLGLKPGVSITELLKHASTPHAEDLKEAGAKLLSALEAQKELNALNKQLLGIHLDYIDGVVHEMAGAPDGGMVYGSKGETQNFHGGGFFNSEI